MMNFILLALLAAIILWAALETRKKLRRGGGCCGEHEAAEKRLAVKDRNKAHYPWAAELEIGGMTCENCARRVENALNALEGVWARVDIGSHRAKLRLQSPPDRDALSLAVAQAGYAVLDYREGKP